MKKLVLSVAVLLATMWVTPAAAAPWWISRFAEGVPTPVSTASGYEEYWARLVQTSPANDTIYLASLDMSDSVYVVVGPNRDSAIGINAIAAARVDTDARIYVLHDSGSLTSRYLSDWDTNIRDTNPPISGSNFNHKALAFEQRNFLAVGSQNFSSVGAIYQPNAMIMLRGDSSVASTTDSGLDVLVRDFILEFKEAGDLGVWTDNVSADSRFVYRAPRGETVELYFMPDDQGGITRNGVTGMRTADVIQQLVDSAQKSIFYAYNIFSFDDLADTINWASAPLKAGLFDFGSAYTRLADSHTVRDWDDVDSGDFMNHRFMVIDLDVVLTGSANLARSQHVTTGPSSTTGDDNLLVLHSPAIARRYAAEFRRIMSILPGYTRAGGDIFESGPPGRVSTLRAVPTDTAFYLDWTAVPDSGDFSRYAVFVSRTPFSRQADIGDNLDNDGDGLVDEDEFGMVDTISGVFRFWETSARTDSWMTPEYFIRGSTPSAVTTIVVQSADFGESLALGTDYYIGIIAVDRWGNEGVLIAGGPVRLSGATLTLPANTVAAPASSDDGTCLISRSAAWFPHSWLRGMRDTFMQFSIGRLLTSFYYWIGAVTA